MDDDGISVKITLREIYDLLLKTAGKVEMLVLQDSSQHNEITELRGRVRDLEKSRWPLPALAVVVSVGTLVYKVITDMG